MRNTSPRHFSCCSERSTRCPRPIAPGPSTLHLPASGAGATLRLPRSWRAPCTACRAGWMALEAAAARDPLSANGAAPNHTISFAATAGCADTQHPARKASCHASASSCAAAAATEAATAPRSDAASSAGRLADAEATGRASSSHSTEASSQLPSSQSPALRFEVSGSRSVRV